MQGFPEAHSVLGRSIAELDARGPSLIDTSLPIDSIPIAGPLVSPLVGDGANGGVQPSSPSGDPSTDNPPSSSASTGSENGNGNGGGGNPTNSPLPTSGGGAVFQPVSIVSNNPLTSAPGSPSGTPNANGGGSAASPSSSGGGGSYPVSSGQPTAAGTTPSGSLGTPPVMLSTNLLAPSQPSGSNTVMGALTPSSTIATGTLSGERLSGGAIAGIIIASLFSLLALILLVFRRRSIARRVELRNQWWFNRTHDRSFSPIGRPRSPMRANREGPVSRMSARSSFATNFDQGLMFRVDPPAEFSPHVVLNYPPAAEVHERNSVLVSTGATVARRSSMNSMLNHNTGPNAQYLSVSPPQNNQEQFTPMSVRPFSPSESFFFPKPPAPSPSDSFFLPGAQGHTSCRSSATTLVPVGTPPRAFMADLPPAWAPIPSLHPQIRTSGAEHPPPISTVDARPDPFADPVKPEFAQVQVICRPFAPSLEDELMVYPGDQVRLFQTFDDGWAFVEKLAKEGKDHERGLIPIDCLREADQPLPTFLAQKRISYGSDEVIGCAL